MYTRQLIEATAAPEEDPWVVAQTIGTFLGLFAIGLAVAALLIERARRVREHDERRFTSTPAAVGCFHTKQVHWIPALFGRQTAELKVPTISGLIEEGDRARWTSSSLDLAFESHSDHTWVTLYESILSFIASRAPSDQWPEDWRADKYVCRFLRRVGSAEHDNHVIKPESFARYLDAHETKKLVSTCRELQKPPRPRQQDQLPNATVARSKKRKTKTGLCRLTSTWIVRGRACIRVTREELAALAIITGMVFTRQDRSLYLSGFGGFGLSLDVSHAEASWSAALVQGPRLPRHAPSLGAGYTTLMAKHLACGSIPFAQNRDWVISVYVTDEVLTAIQEGGNIIDKRAFGGDSLEFLRRLPGDKLIDALYGVYGGADVQKSPGPSFGAILHADRETELGKWPHAVAQIAFGGLVPQANPNVVEAVRFTATGSEEDMGECVVALESLVDMLHGSQEDDHLFGDNVSGRCAAEGHSWVNYTFPSEHSNAPDAVAIFARYSNLLERAIAMVVGRPMPGEQTDTSQAPPQTRGLPASCGRLVQEGDIVEAAGRELEKSYRAAVARKTGEAAVAGSAEPGVGNLESVQDVKNRFRENGALEVPDVAIIVRCLLASWAFTVPLIEVKQTAEMRGAAGTPGAGTTKLPNEIVLSNLPPISSLC